MKIGICCSELKYLEYIERFDFVEVSLNSNLELLFPYLKKITHANYFLPREVNIFDGYKLSSEALRSAISNIEKSSQFGVEKITFGSGKSRNIPSFMEEEVAEELFQEFVFRLLPYLRENGIDLCIEPLLPKETNFINTLEHGTEIVKTINSKNVGITIDSYHVPLRDFLSSTPEQLNSIYHFHLSSKDRAFPDIDELPYELKSFVRDKYRQRSLSIEIYPFQIPENFEFTIRELQRLCHK